MSHLYIHVPFCRRRCSYCDFAIAVRRRVPVERYVRSVHAEFAHRRDEEGWGGAAFDTIYLGGGTPSLLADAVASLLAPLPRSDGAEVTLEANPDDVDRDRVRAWRDAGVTRVSLGVQSFDDRVLAWMHRTHDAARAARAVTDLRRGGIPSVSVDLIFALPEGVDRVLRADLDALLALAPDHVSAYGLTLEPRTPYAKWVDRGEAAPADDDRYAAEFLQVHEALSAAGYEHYEVSNYARPGLRSRHNTAYWQGREYMGLGPAAHGLRQGTRRWNLPNWSAYERALRAGEDPVAGTEDLSPADRRLERVLLGLRTVGGIGAAEAAALDPGARLAAERAGWLTATADGVRLTVEGWLVLDALLPALTTFSESG